MAKLTPVTKQLLFQRDKEIFEYIQVFLEKGYTAREIYQKLHRLTGLEPTTIQIIRFDMQKKLAQSE